jgi:hypothetical protein
VAEIKHTDWDVSVSHQKAINEHWPSDVYVRKPELRKVIPGLTGKRINSDVRSGMWMKPLGSETSRSFSSVRDITRKTLVLFVSGSSTEQSRGATDYEVVRDMIRDLFQDRRATGLCGEMFSKVSTTDYDIDDAISRKYDIDLLEINSIFREDR